MNRVYHLHLSATLTEKLPQKSETVTVPNKDGFEQMEHEFPFGTFRPGKQGYFFRRRSVVPGNFPPERPEKSCSITGPS